MHALRFRIAQWPARHRNRARHRDWLFEWQRLRAVNVADNVDLIGFGNRYDIACLNKRIRLRFSAESIVQAEADESTLIARPGTGLSHFCLPTTDDVDRLRTL